MATWLIWFVVYWGAGTRSFVTHAGHSSQRDRISMLVMAFGALGVFGSTVLVLLGIVSLPQSELVVLLGAALACVGVTGSFYCRYVLGRFWSATHDPSGEPRDHRQRPLRHGAPPDLHGDAGVLPGDDVAFSAWWSWALLTLWLVGYVLKALDEERFLGAHLTPAYEDYRRRVPYRLVPGVW
jgi:protein-S-isoprenylcysteine O-methyltransferase Ste14